MAVAIGNTITAAQYNGVQSRIAAVLGTGSGNFGYGQTVSSVQVATATDTITAAQMDLLRADMNKAYVHQQGTNIPLRNISAGDVIGADVSGDTITYDSLGNYTITDGAGSADTTGGFNDYLDQMDALEAVANRFLVDGGQSTVADLATDTRTTNWNTSINHEFSVTFSNEDHRRYFFNSGGQIRISLAMSGGSGQKDTDWSNMISNLGVVQIGHDYTTVSGSTTGVTINSIGNYDFTTTYTEILRKGGNAAVYAENYWTIEAKLVGTTQLVFRITLVDADTGDRPVPPDPPPYGALVDEYVIGDITATISTRRASGTNVSVTNPSVAVLNTFE